MSKLPLVVETNTKLCFSAIYETFGVGEVFVYIRDETGRFMLNETKDQLIDKRMTGSVVIEIPKVGNSLNLSPQE